MPLLVIHHWAEVRGRWRLRRLDIELLGRSGEEGRRAVVGRPLPLVGHGVGGTLAAAAGDGARVGAGTPRVGRRGRGTQQFGGGSGAQGVARVVAHGLPAVRRAAVARLHEPTTRGNKENGCKMEAEDAARGSIFGFSPQSEVSRVC